MGKINDRNYQLKLALHDPDLRKPKHDEIMHWLDKWVTDCRNVEEFFEDRRERMVWDCAKLDDESQTIVNASPHKDSILEQFRMEFKETSRNRNEPWNDEPRRSIEYVARQWEKMLHGDTGGSYRPMIGFCDYVATYNVTAETNHYTIHTKKLTSADPDPELSRKYFNRWRFKPVETKTNFVNLPDQKQIFFEVKTEITSIGEVMRQLELYRSSLELRNASRKNEICLVLVAPPNYEAASVVRSHGFGFVEYR